MNLVDNTELYEVLLELKILYEKMQENNRLFSENFNISKMLFALTYGISRDQMFNMTNNEFIEHIRKVQIVES